VITTRRSGIIIGRKVSGATVGAAAAAGGGGGADGGGVSFAAGAVAGLAAVAGLTTFGGAAVGVCGVAAGVGAATAAGAAAGDAGMVGLTAVWHGAESLARFCLRQSSASLVPGVTLEQFAMKSDQQFERIVPKSLSSPLNVLPTYLHGDAATRLFDKSPAITLAFPSLGDLISRCNAVIDGVEARHGHGGERHREFDPGPHSGCRGDNPRPRR
jgi:hypothetical protein